MDEAPPPARDGMPDHRRPLVPRCRCCRRGLQSVAGSVCPDCGTGFDLADPRTHLREPAARVLLLEGLAGRVRLAELAIRRAGIDVVVQEDHGFGGLPSARLWVADDDAVEAVAALDGAPAESGQPWRCACGETHEGQFAECWQCGSPQPEDAASATAAASAAASEPAGPPPRTVVLDGGVSLEELAIWYREHLGLEPDRVAPQWLRYAGEPAGVLVLAGDLEGADEPEDPRPVLTHAVASVIAAAARLEAAGAGIVDAEPFETPGGRSVLFVDPFGLVHELREPG